MPATSWQKKNSKPKTIHYFASNHKPKQKPQAEVPLADTRTYPEEEPKKEEVTQVAKEQSKSPETLEQLHVQENKVVEENKLPATTSEKHEQIRKQVAENLKNKKNNEPLELAPLYFTFDQDEFSVVDMDPFLVAVEYALQGRTILIEGHTDNQGKDDYNVQLSVKRVQKIRQLMNDMGVPDDRISVVGYGEEISKHDNSSTAGRQLNRRVDFKAF